MKEKNKKDTFFENIKKRGDITETIYDFLKNKTVQECINILDAVKRKILDRTIV